jgi:hypothetical protein
MAAGISCGKTTSLNGRACPCAVGYVCCATRCIPGGECPSPESMADAGAFARPDGFAGSAPEADGSANDAELGSSTGSGDGGADTSGSGERTQPYVDISVGDRYACVIRENGTVGCWGQNFARNEATPVGTFKQVSLGTNSWCALAGDGSIRCWGPCTSTIGDPCLRPPAGPFAFLSSGSDDRCAIAGDGSVTCWGRSAPQAPAGSFQKVAVGQSFACGVRSTGGIVCWGPSATGMQVPTQTYVDVAASADWACGLTREGTITCWGSPPLVPLVPELTGQSAVALGAQSGCALDAAGALKCWAKTDVTKEVPSSVLRFKRFSMSYDSGCGITTENELSCPTVGLPGLHPPVTPVLDVCIDPLSPRICWISKKHELRCTGVSPSKVTGLSRIFCGHNLMCGLNLARDLLCWGNESPVSVAAGPFTEVAIPSDDVACALRADGTIKCFGSGTTAQAPAGPFRAIAAANGNICGLRSDRSMACWGVADPQPVIPGRLVGLAASRLFMCAIEESGRVVCSGTEGASLGPPPPGRFTQISVSESHGCGLRDGAAFCWGNPATARIRPTQAPSGAFATVHVNNDVSCGLRPNGRLVCWGAVEWPDEPRPLP